MLTYNFIFEEYLGVIKYVEYVKPTTAAKTAHKITIKILFKTNFATSGITALLALVGLIIIAALYIRKVNGALFFGIIITWIIGIICQFVGLYVPDPAAGFYSLMAGEVASLDLNALPSLRMFG